MATQAYAQQAIAQQKGGLLSRLAAAVRRGEADFAEFLAFMGCGIAIGAIYDEWYGWPGR